MKKRVLSVLLVIALLVAVGIVAAQADETPAAENVIAAANALTIDPENPTAVCPYCNEETTWTKLDANTTAIGLGHYFLDGAVSTNSKIYNSNSANGISCIFMNPKSSLTTYGAAAFGGAVRLMGNGTVTVAVKPANETAGTDSVTPAAILEPGSSAKGMHVYGGTYGGTVNSGYGGVYGHSGVLGNFNVYGGTFNDPTYSNTTVPIISPYNGAVVNIYGGNIDTVRLHNFNHTGSGRVNVYGGNITKLNANDGILVVEGGNITTLTPTATMDSITISGNPVIGTLGLTVKPTFGALTDGASIGLGTYTGTISTAYETAAEAQAVAATFPVPEHFEVTVDESTNALVYGAKKYTSKEIAAGSKAQSFTLADGESTVEAFCYHCGEKATWKPFTASMASTTNAISGHYFIAEDITVGADTALAQNVTPINANGDICIHLNGKTWTTTYASGPISSNPGVINFATAANCAVMGNGSVTASLHYVLRVGSTADAHIYGGTWEGSGVTAYSYGMWIQSGTTTFYDDVTIASSKNVLWQQGGNLYIEGGTYSCSQLWFNGTTYINGGTFSAYLTARNASKTTTITGGTFNNYLSATGGNFELQGGTYNSTLRIDTKGKMILKGGTFNNAIGNTGGTIEIDGATFTKNININNNKTAGTPNILNIKSGTVTGTITTATSANVTTDTQVNISGGTVTSTLTMNYGTLNISGGTVSSVVGATTTTAINISGGDISAATIPAGITTTLSGAPTVGALNMAEGATVDATGLTGGKIGMGTTSGVFTTAFADKAAAEAAEPYFKDGWGKAVTVVEQVGDEKTTYVLSNDMTTYTSEQIVELAAAQEFGTTVTTEWCYVCNEEVTWRPITKLARPYEGEMSTILSSNHYHYYVANDISVNDASGIFYMYISTARIGTYCLHMNGKTLENTSNTGYIIRQHGTQCSINVMGDGVMKTGAVNFGAIHANGGVLNTRKEYHINSYFAGDIYNLGKAVSGESTNNYCISTSGNAVMNIYGGTLHQKLNSSGTTTLYGGTVASVASDGYEDVLNLTVEGGTIGQLNVQGTTSTVKINGGTINNLLMTEFANTPVLTGAPTIKAVTWREGAEGKVLDLTGMTGGSLNIGDFEGIFTTEFADAAAAAAVAKYVTSSSKVATVTDAFALETTDGRALIINGDEVSAYADLAAAVDAYTEGYIKMLADDDIVLTKDVTVDLNGKNIGVSGEYTFTGFDSTTYKTYDAVPGNAEIAEGVIVATPAATEAGTLTTGYLAVDNLGFTTFTYYEMKLSGVALKANRDNVGMYYKGIWSLNEYLPDDCLEAGVVVSLCDDDMDDFIGENSEETTVNYYFGRAPQDIVNGEAMTSVLVDNIMKSDRDPADNKAYAEMPVYARAYISVDGKNILSASKDLSISGLLQLFEAEGNEAVYEANADKLNNFYDAWVERAQMNDWGLTKIGQTVES